MSPTPTKPAPKAVAPKLAARPFAPAQAVFVALGRWRVDGHDAKRQHRRFFVGPNAEAEAKKHAAELNAAPRGTVANAPSKPGAKLGGALRAVLDAHAGLKAKQAATAKAKQAAAEKAAAGKFVALHTEEALGYLDALKSSSPRDAVIFAIGQAEAAGLPQARVEAMLKARGWDQGRLAGMANGLRAETARA